MGEYLVDVLAGGSVATYEKSGTSVALHVRSIGGLTEGVLSTLNSTTAPLLANGSFVGTGEIVKDYSTITVSVLTDSIGSLCPQFSSDNVNWDFCELFLIGSNDPRTLPSNPRAQYFRVLYYNSNDAQTFFRLQTLYKYVQVNPRIFPLDKTLIDENAAQLTRAVLAAKKPNQIYTNIDCTAGGNLKISVEEFDNSVILPVQIIGSISSYEYFKEWSGSILLSENIGSSIITNLNNSLRHIIITPTGNSTNYYCQLSQFDNTIIFSRTNITGRYSVIPTLGIPLIGSIQLFIGSASSNEYFFFKLVYV